MRRHVALLIVATLAVVGAIPVFAAEGDAHWSYDGATGPAAWAGLEPEFATCGLGKTQSPIDIRDENVTPAYLPAIRFDYKPGPLRIIDNGHTIQINVEPGSSIKVGDAKYDLVQFHFHKPSEEKVNGKAFDMVAHLVHKDAEGKLAVVAVLLRQGSESSLIKTLWANLPTDKGKELAVDAVTINAADLLPRRLSYYKFMGSFTTPPCTEGVTWFVLRSPSQISEGELATFGRIYPVNARPVQPVNGRTIQASKQE